jgi:hypothetical protein
LNRPRFNRKTSAAKLATVGNHLSLLNVGSGFHVDKARCLSEIIPIPLGAAGM